VHPPELEGVIWTEGGIETQTLILLYSIAQPLEVDWEGDVKKGTKFLIVQHQAKVLQQEVAVYPSSSFTVCRVKDGSEAGQLNKVGLFVSTNRIKTTALPHNASQRSLSRHV
jgi:hypothetical protein